MTWSNITSSSVISVAPGLLSCVSYVWQNWQYIMFQIGVNKQSTGPHTEGSSQTKSQVLSDMKLTPCPAFPVVQWSKKVKVKTNTTQLTQYPTPPFPVPTCSMFIFVSSILSPSTCFYLNCLSNVKLNHEWRDLIKAHHLQSWASMSWPRPYRSQRCQSSPNLRVHLINDKSISPAKKSKTVQKTL